MAWNAELDDLYSPAQAHREGISNKIFGREDVDKSFRPGFPGFEVVRA